MIASTNVARWTWGRDDESADALVLCMRDLLAAYGVLSANGFAVGQHAVRVSVTEAGGKPRKPLFEGEFTVPVDASSSTESVAQLVGRVRAGMRAGEIGSVDAFVECSGALGLGASSFADYVVVDLVTKSDVWLPYDLKGRPQPDVYAANGPRLSALLRDLSEVLESETDPGEPTYFAKPTETGAENFFHADGTAWDVWGSFEELTRYGVFRHAPGFGRIGYRRMAEGDVRYVPVQGGHAAVLGYLWASDFENAASFEPRDVGDDVTYRAGLVWLERLRSAHDRGLSPSAALAELSAMPDEKGAGRVDPASEPCIVGLDSLRELASGGR
ncbi:hypothetical protein [Streptomyces sp. A30]|uniref:hypothetical protein n=1 Tax=Streptomyces sp. A30 TaxID=2789273 RepID=UPI00397EBFE3